MKLIKHTHPALLPLTAPLSAAYSLAVRARNFLYDAGVIKTQTFDVPLIGIGNITVGGTGKTPHVEYMIHLICSLKLAVVSRGYGRRTKGFRYVEVDDDPADVGDEPLMLKRKCPPITVAVDERRERAIARIMRDDCNHQAIILDDAFQYRRVKPALNIVLVDYNNLVYDDLMLPAGRLRDNRSSLKRADMIFVTKCPVNISEYDRLMIREKINRYVKCPMFFTVFEYGIIKPLFELNTFDANGLILDPHIGPCFIEDYFTVHALAGIANPKVFFDEVFARYLFNPKEVKEYPDHYAYTADDVKGFAKHTARGDVFITTEKDAVKLREFADILTLDEKRRFFYLPVKVELANGDFLSYDQNFLSQYLEKLTYNENYFRARVPFRLAYHEY